MTSITLISDTHNRHNEINVGSGDLLIHAGDATSRGKDYEIQKFLMWYGAQDYECKIFVPGNHDFGFEQYPALYADMARQHGVELLNDSEFHYRGIKIWGSPVQPWFGGWAFNRMESKARSTPEYPWIGHHWDLIPDDTDILITHGPAYGILDLTQGYDRAGSESLTKRIKGVLPVLHVCGHIHEDRGWHNDGHTIYVNASCLDRSYEPYDQPVFTTHWESMQRGVFP